MNQPQNSAEADAIMLIRLQEKGYKVPYDLTRRLGFSLNRIEHVFTQLPFMVEEAKKRIKHAPFDFDGMYVGHSGGKDSVLVRWLVDQALGDKGKSMLTVHTPKPAGVRNAVHQATKEFLYSLNRPVLYLPVDADHKQFGLKTQIDGTRMAEAARRDGRDVGVVVRGKERSRADMPLYLEDGLFNLQFIYPIFDWTDLQVWSAIFLYQIPFSDEYHDEEYEF